jgi:FtsH-binding integral membrane protein
MVTGKSSLFLAIVILGYVCGIIHKAIYSRDIVIYLYALNLILVVIDLGLCLYYSNPAKPENSKTKQQRCLAERAIIVADDKIELLYKRERD